MVIITPGNGKRKHSGGDISSQVKSLLAGREARGRRPGPALPAVYRLCGLLGR